MIRSKDNKQRKGEKMITNKSYYVKVNRPNNRIEYICAPKGWRWTENGIIKDGEYKGSPEITLDPYKRYSFKSHRSAAIQANMLNGAEIINQSY